MTKASGFASAIVVTATLSATSVQAALVLGFGTTTNVTCADHVCTATAADARLSLHKLEQMLAHASVTVVSGSRAVDIAVEGSLAWTSTSTLTLDSYRAITIDKPVAVQGDGGLTLTTNDGGTGGILSFGPKGNVTFLNLSSPLTIDGHAYTLVGDVATLANDVQSDYNGHTAGYYALATNYDAGPDGTYTTSPVAAPLDGRFEGLGNRIANVTVNDPTLHVGVGFFSDVHASGVVADIGLINVNISGYGGGGALAGGNEGTIRHAFAAGQVATSGGGGGLVSGNSGLIEYSWASVTVTSSGFAGGLAGYSNGSIIQSFAMGSTYSSSTVGGLVGFDAGGLVSLSYAEGNVSGFASNYVGGLIGQNEDGQVTQGYETGAVSNGTVGALIGTTNINVTSCYWDTTTTGLHGKSAGTGDHHRTAGMYPISSGQLKAALPAGFDPTVWGQDSRINGGFPYLLANPPR